jgi:hypothetical protein
MKLLRIVLEKETIIESVGMNDNYNEPLVIRSSSYSL